MENNDYGLLYDAVAAWTNPWQCKLEYTYITQKPYESKLQNR